MNLSYLFALINFSSVFLSFSFDVLEYLQTYNFYSLLAIVFSIALTLVPFVMKEDAEIDNKLLALIFSRNFYFIPTCLFVLIFKGMAYGHSPIEGYTAISFWSFILASYCGHYMKSDDGILYDLLNKPESKTNSISFFAIIKILVLTGCLVADTLLYSSWTSMEHYMHTIFLISLVCFAYLELMIFLINFVLRRAKSNYNFVLVKPLQIVFSSLALGSASFSYASYYNHWHKLLTIIALFLIIYAKHYFSTYKSV